MKHNFDQLVTMLGEIEGKLGYVFKDKSKLILALTHSSYANERKSEKLHYNERLEFLGDSILSFIISEHIYQRYQILSEGEMTKMRASIVCEPSLKKCSDEIGIGEYLLLGRGEENTGGRTRVSILSDAFEALLGAIYIDGGMDCARAFIFKFMGTLLEESSKGTLQMDYKTSLQEVLQKNGENKITYEIIKEAGPDHNKFFVSRVSLGNTTLGTGEGRSKKEAEQNAAKDAMERQPH